MLALARKYRPRNFASVAVQSHVSNTLKGAIARGRVAHGYLLCGPRGTGKTTLARVLAMALNCENRGGAEAGPGEPCGECQSCTRIWRGDASLDVVEIDAASNRGVDDARDLRERAMYAPTGDDRYKVYIVDEAHMLTREAWNALLKVLEEPPPRVVFVFATTEPQKIAQLAAPVLSRLQRFDLKRIGASDVRARLTEVLALEGVEANPDALSMIARAADGSMRDALSLTDQVLAMGEGRLTPERVREALGLVAEDEYLALLDIVAGRRAADVFAAVGRLADAGVDFGGLLTGLADVLRAQLALSLGGEPGDVSERMREQLHARRERLAPADLLRMLNVLAELEPRFRKSGQQQLLLETALVRLTLMDRTVALEEVLRGMSGSGGGTVSTMSPRDVAARDTRPRAQAETPRSLAPVERADAVAPPLPTAEAPARPLPRINANALAGRWDDIVARLRGEGRALLAAAMASATPVAVSAQGVVTIQLDEADEIRAQALDNGRKEIVAALGALFSGVERVNVRVPDGLAQPQPPRRITDESIRTERIAALRKRDGVLGAAVDALDLELLD